MKKIISIIVVLSSIYFYACSCNCNNDNSIPPNKNMVIVPKVVLAKGEEVITSKVGKEFYQSFVKLNYEQLKSTGNYFEMKYTFSIPEKLFVRGDIYFTLDTLGNLIKGREISGIPDCVSDPSSCQFNIDETQAMKIAKEVPLKEGIKSWKTSFTWNGKYNRYVWYIVSVSEESEGSNGYRGKGQYIVIDTFEGKVLEFSDWNVR